MSNVSIYLLLGLLALLSAALTWWLICGRSSLKIMDSPNHRSLHSVPVPRTGGIAVVISLLLGLQFLHWRIGGDASLMAVFWAILLIAVCSFIDDVKGLSVRLRLLIQFLVVICLITWGYRLVEIGVPGSSFTVAPLVSIPITIIFMIWSINMYNFMDGMDGFAAGMTIIGFSTFAVLGVLAHNDLFVAMNLVVVASAAGFWFFNFPPAKIFLGDTGSSVLGLCFAVLAIWGVNDGVFSIWVAAIIFSPFLVDASYTLLRRMFAGERFWEAHKSHFYQRLVEYGYGHKKVVLGEYLLMLVCAAFAVVISVQTAAKTVQLIGILVVATLYTMGIILLHKHLRTD